MSTTIEDRMVALQVPWRCWACDFDNSIAGTTCTLCGAESISHLSHAHDGIEISAFVARDSPGTQASSTDTALNSSENGIEVGLQPLSSGTEPGLGDIEISSGLLASTIDRLPRFDNFDFSIGAETGISETPLLENENPFRSGALERSINVAQALDTDGLDAVGAQASSSDQGVQQNVGGVFAAAPTNADSELSDVQANSDGVLPRPSDSLTVGAQMASLLDSVRAMELRLLLGSSGFNSDPTDVPPIAVQSSSSSLIFPSPATLAELGSRDTLLDSIRDLELRQLARERERAEEVPATPVADMFDVNEVQPAEMPAFESTIEGLPIHTVTAEELRDLSEDHVSCAICIEDFAEGDQLRTLPCFHRYHQICIDGWLRHSGLCPMCKTRVG